MSNQTVQITQHPKFAELVKRRTRFAVILSILVLVPYYSFMMVVAFAPNLLRQTLSADSIITIAWPIGALIVIGAWILTGIYIRRANGEFDDLNQAILKDTMK